MPIELDLVSWVSKNALLSCNVTPNPFLNISKLLKSLLMNSFIDASISDDDLVIHILNGVGPKFKELATAVCARDNPRNSMINLLSVKLLLNSKSILALPVPSLPTLRNTLPLSILSIVALTTTTIISPDHPLVHVTIITFEIFLVLVPQVGVLQIVPPLVAPILLAQGIVRLISSVPNRVITPNSALN